MFGFSEYIDAPGVVQTYLNSPDLSVQEIARRFGTTATEVYRQLRASDVLPNRYGVNRHKVENLANLGWSVKQIAEFTGYTPRNVRYILARNG